MCFYHKDTLEKLVIDREIGGEYNEESEEYKLICMYYEVMFGLNVMKIKQVLMKCF